MPSGHSGGHSGGGHFGGGSISSRSGGHFSGAHSSGSRGIHRPWYSPRVIVFGGRQVYLGSGRASTVSVLGVLIIFGILASIIVGAIWSDCDDKIKTIKTDYAFYHAMAQKAEIMGSSWQTIGKVTEIKAQEDGDKYCLLYTFKVETGNTVEGYSFYVYDFATALKYKSGEETLVLALDSAYENSNTTTDSVPLDYKDTTLNDDGEYTRYQNELKVVRTLTFVFIGVTVAMALGAALVPLTAKKATQEQIAANNQNSSTNTDNQSAPEGTWRCSYCGALNDNGKERCDGCGAKRQK